MTPPSPTHSHVRRPITHRRRITRFLRRHLPLSLHPLRLDKHGKYTSRLQRKFSMPNHLQNTRNGTGVASQTQKHILVAAENVVQEGGEPVPPRGSGFAVVGFPKRILV